MNDHTFQTVPHRGLTADTLRFYNVVTRVDGLGTPVSTGFPYGPYSDGQPKAIKVRDFNAKKFYSTGEMSDAQIFGQDRFGAGSAKAITLTEGEYDALSVFQILGSKYPACSVRGAGSARRDCQAAFDYLNSFETIYLAFDSDSAGEQVLQDVAGLFNPNKLRHVRLDRFKDANEYLVNGAADEFRRAWYNAKPYLPKGIVGDWSTIEEILKKEDNQAVGTYPFSTLDNMAYGIRLGELVLLTAQEKIGKTEVLRAIEYHLLANTDANIGIIHLEESEKRSVQGLASYVLSTPCHLPDSSVSTTDVLSAYKVLTKRDGRAFLYTHFGADDPNAILDAVRYLASVCECKFIFLDHLTMLVSGFEDEDERRKLDFISTRLAMLTRELNCTIFVVSHVNDDGKPRGSRMISKVCDLHLYLTRDKETADATARNTVSVMVRDNRFAGQTGPAGQLVFDPRTFIITEKVIADAEGF